MYPCLHGSSPSTIYYYHLILTNLYIDLSYQLTFCHVTALLPGYHVTSLLTFCWMLVHDLFLSFHQMHMYIHVSHFIKWVYFFSYHLHNFFGNTVIFSSKYFASPIFFQFFAIMFFTFTFVFSSPHQYVCIVLQIPLCGWIFYLWSSCLALWMLTSHPCPACCFIYTVHIHRNRGV